MRQQNIAIIGAGLSGLSLAEELNPHANITVFEKSRGVGGRMSTRYTDDFQFDHGAQYFTARSKSFQGFLKPFIEQGLVQEWRPKVVTLEVGEKPYKRDWFEPHYTANPKINMLCKAIAEKHDVRIKTQIKDLVQEAGAWFLIDDEDLRHGPFDWVVSSAPAPQTSELFPHEFLGHNLIVSTKMQGCYSLMLGFPEGLKLNWNAAKVKNSPIGWIAVDSSKPSRESGYSLLVQTTNEWAEGHIEDPQENVLEVMLCEVEKLLERDIKNAAYKSLHRWRYANTIIDEDAEGGGYLVDHTLKLAACGDWCVQGHVESAYLSALSLAGVLKNPLLVDSGSPILPLL
jgi:renalase